MYDNVFSAFNCFKSFFDQFRTRLYQYLNRYIIGNMMPFDQSAQDLIFGFRCRRKTNFYFFKANIYQSLTATATSRSVRRKSMTARQ